MEWRQQTSVSCEDAFNEAQRWIEDFNSKFERLSSHRIKLRHLCALILELACKTYLDKTQEVTGKSFGCNNFRAALENGVLLCDLINQLKPGIIKRLNRLSTPIAGLDNVNVFLKACGKLGLNESQTFHPGDLQDLSTRVTLRQDESSRRLKNVLITIYWLGRKAHQDPFYSGPQLNFKAFEGLLGLALSKALEEGSNVSGKDSWYPEKEDCELIRPSYKRENSLDSISSLDFRAPFPNNEGSGSDAEAEQVFRMDATQRSAQQNKGYMPPPLLRRKLGQENHGRGSASPLSSSFRTYQNQVRPEKPVQVNPGWIWSKSLSDIPMVYPVRKVSRGNTFDQDTNMMEEWNRENDQKNSVAAKDTDVHWQDDLTKWKNRRRSTKSDLHQMSQDREHVIDKMSNGAVKKETQGGLLKRDQQTPRRHSSAPRPYSTSSPSKPPSSDLRPRTRALLARSYATEAPFSPTVPLNHTQKTSAGLVSGSEGNILGEKTHIASLASDGAWVTTPSQACLFSSQTQVKAQPKETIKSVSTRDPTATLRSQEENQKTSLESDVDQGSGQQSAGVYRNWSTSASLPRGFRRSEGSSRLSSAVTPRPFGTKNSRVNSLPRLYNVDHSDMRLSLTLKPKSRQDFGFQTHWDSMGARVKSIEPGSPAELCQLCVDDEIVAVDGIAVANMNHNQWKDKMTHALQNGSLTMDVRRYGNKDWSSIEGSYQSPAGQSRMTLNLTPAACVLIGCSDHYADGADSTDNIVTKVSKFNGQTENVVQGRILDGEHGDSHKISRSKDYKKSLKKNQKRRAEFFKQKGGSESAISDLQVPSLSPSSSSWSWDCEEDRRRQEKWQEEQERLLQEQYKRDQERLEAEWRKAQENAVGDLCKNSGQNTFEIPNGGESHAGTQPHVNGVTNKTTEEEWSLEKDELKEAGSTCQSNSQLLQNDLARGSDWMKSLSTPGLSGPHKQTGGDQRKRKGHSVSKVEKERQQILEEMKKRTQLLTDNSWIRQRSTSYNKEPVHTGFPLKRHESLDNLDILSPVLTNPPFSYPRPHSAAAGYCVPSRNSTSRYSTGGISSQRSASGDSSHHGRMVSGRRTCCVCKRALGSGAAMIMKVFSLCFHLACFQCVGCYRYLTGTETGVQVRLQNRKPCCEPCYFQPNSTVGPSL